MRSNAPKICFIDAASRYGVALGHAGQVPEAWTGNLARDGASAAAKSGGAMRLMTQIIEEHRPDEIVIEAPMPTSFARGKTNIKTTQILVGMCFAMQGMAYLLGFHRVSFARVRAIRMHFIGANPKGDLGKKKVRQKCFDLGWVQPSDRDVSTDRTDALAGWSFAEHAIAPSLATPVDDLWAASERRKREAAPTLEHHP